MWEWLLSLIRTISRRLARFISAEEWNEPIKRFCQSASGWRHSSSVTDSLTHQINIFYLSLLLCLSRRAFFWSDHPRRRRRKGVASAFDSSDPLITLQPVEGKTWHLADSFRKGYALFYIQGHWAADLPIWLAPYQQPHMCPHRRAHTGLPASAGALIVRRSCLRFTLASQHGDARWNSWTQLGVRSPSALLTPLEHADLDRHQWHLR